MSRLRGRSNALASGVLGPTWSRKAAARSAGRNWRAVLPFFVLPAWARTYGRVAARDSLPLVKLRNSLERRPVDSATPYNNARAEPGMPYRSSLAAVVDCSQTHSSVKSALRSLTRLLEGLGARSPTSGSRTIFRFAASHFVKPLTETTTACTLRADLPASVRDLQ